MNIEQIKTLEEQANSFINNIALIQQELSKKVSDRKQFESETNKIVKSLTEITHEFNAIQSLFGAISESNMVLLFSEIEQTNAQLKQIPPSFDKQVSRGLSQFTDLHHRLEETSQRLNEHFVNYSKEITDLTTVMERQQQDLISYMNRTKDEFVTHTEAVNKQVFDSNLHTSSQLSSILNQLNTNAQSQSILSEKMDWIVKQLHENANHHEHSNEKMNWMVDQLNESIQSQKQLSEKTNQLSDWLNINGEILVTNSRAGLFGKKK